MKKRSVAGDVLDIPKDPPDTQVEYFQFHPKGDKNPFVDVFFDLEDTQQYLKSNPAVYTIGNGRHQENGPYDEYRWVFFQMGDREELFKMSPQAYVSEPRLLAALGKNWDHFYDPFICLFWRAFKKKSRQ